MNIAIGSDERTHLTDFVVEEVRKRGHKVELFGPLKNDPMNWVEVGTKVALAVSQGKVDEGILFCWTGTGASIAANKVSGIRAALCSDSQTAEGARKWNLANILVMGIRLVSEPVASEILDVWFGTEPGIGEYADIVAELSRIEREGRWQEE